MKNSTLVFSGSNANILTGYFTVLTYDNIYQNGYVFAITDSVEPTPLTGTVVSTANEVGLPWDSTIPLC